MSAFYSAYREMRRFQKLDRSERSIVFYAESESYWNYLYPFIISLIEDYGKIVCYLTSSPSDPVLKNSIDGISPFFIGDGIVRTILFASLDVDVIVMTLPDLGTYNLKRSKYPVHYVFVPHNMLSTHMVFRKGAYDAFDTIFCVGPHHLAELREAEDLYELPKRALVEIGYVHLDTLREKKVLRSHSNLELKPKILIAPSWQPHGILETVGLNMVSALLSEDFSVAVRPHRDTNRALINKFQDKFGKRQNFSLVLGTKGLDVFFESDVLITDWSGSSLSFAFANEKPVLFVDTPRKILNQDYDCFSNSPLEITIREKIGKILKIEEIEKVPKFVQLLHDNRETWKECIRTERNYWVYNHGTSAKLGAEYIAKL